MNAKSGVNIDNSNRPNLAFISTYGSYQKPVIAVLSLVSTGIDIIKSSNRTLNKSSWGAIAWTELSLKSYAKCAPLLDL